MYRFGCGEFGLRESLRREAALAHGLAVDLMRILTPDGLCEKAIASAPCFERFSLATIPVTVCMGAMRQSESQSEVLTCTDAIVVDGRTKGWIRTRSGLYRVDKEVAHQCRR